MYVYIIFISLLIGLSRSCTGNELRLFNMEFVNNNSTQKYNFKYDNLTVKHHVLNETDSNYTAIFKFIWNYQNEEEKQKGHEIYTNLVDKLDEIREDYGMVIVFFNKDFKNLKFSKKTEFGTAYVIESEQKGTKINLQFQVKPNQPNQEELDRIFDKIFHKSNESDIVEFLKYLLE